MGRLRLLPAAEDVVDRHQLDLREIGDILGVGRFRVARAIEVPGDDRLSLRRVEEFEIGLRLLAGLLGVDIGVNQRNRRLGQDRQARHDDIELVGAEFLQGEEGLVLPG